MSRRHLRYYLHPHALSNNPRGWGTDFVRSPKLQRRGVLQDIILTPAGHRCTRARQRQERQAQQPTLLLIGYENSSECLR